MAVSLSNIKKGSLVHRFITSGKPGNCKFCLKFAEKLEAHHTCYSPQITIKLCHLCHHKAHFWPQRLTDREKLILLKTRFHHQTAISILKNTRFNIDNLREYIAPSKSRFIKKHQKLEIKKLKDHKEKVFKSHILNKSKSLSKKVGRH